MQNVVVEIQKYQEKWLQFLERMDTNRCTNKHYSINKKAGEIKNNERKDERTNFSLRVK